MAKKPTVRFDRNIFKDIVAMCDRDSGQSNRDFTLVISDRDRQRRFESTPSLQNVTAADSSTDERVPKKKPAPPKKYTSKRVVQQEVSQSAEKLVRQKKSPKMLPDKSTKSSQSEQRDISSKDTSKTSLQMSAELESDQVNSSIEHEESVNFGDEENVKSGDEEKMLPAKSTAAKTNAGVSETYAHHPGFFNPLFMCYMNASLQALLAADPFCNYLNELDVDKNEEKYKILYHLVWLSRVMDGAESVDKIELKTAIKYIGKNLAVKQFGLDPSKQQDAHEFITQMLDAMQSDISSLNPDLDICKDLFILNNTYLPSLCPSCEKNAAPSEDQEHIIFNLDMQSTEEGESIQELIDKNLEAEFEERCCKKDVQCTSQITKMPKILLVGLKRYNQSSEKITTSVEISSELVLARFNADGTRTEDSSDVGSESQHVNIIYELKGIVNHDGVTIKEGHYSAYVYDKKLKEWLNCSDLTVKKEDLSRAICSSSETCYLLVYTAMEEGNEETRVESDEESQEQENEEQVDESMECGQQGAEEGETAMDAQSEDEQSN